MDHKGGTNWGSMLVPCVQEMVKDSTITTVPPRYVRPYEEHSTVALEIPVIDMKKLLSEESKDSELAKLDYACKDWGFFQLINHGIDASLLDKVKTGVQDFFNLPMEDKLKFWQSPGDLEGFGQVFVVSENQKLDWGDLFFMTTKPVSIRKPQLFPKIPLPFRDALDVYSTELESLASALLEKMGKALKIKHEELGGLFEGGMQSMRMNYYPPCPQPDQVIGLTPHSDAVGLTILLQVSEVEGLQIRKDGSWVTVKLISNAFIVNVGDILEIITNGTYGSIEHRAVVNAAKERLSVATFHSPRLDVDVAPAKGLVTPQNPARFRSVTAEDYFKGLFSRELDGKSYLDHMRLQLENTSQLTMH